MLNQAITYPPVAKLTKYLTLQNLLVLCICLLLIILPSVNMSELYNSTHIGKFIFFAYAMIGISFIYLVDQLLKKQIMINLSVLDILLFVLLTYIIINRYFIQDIYSFSLRFYELIGLAVLYVIFRSIPQNYYIFFLLAVIVGGIIQAVYGNLQLLGFYNSFNANFKMTGTFFNPGPYAGYLAAIFPMALGIYLFKNKLAEELPVLQSMPKLLRQLLLEYIPLAGVLSILLVLPASRSRAAWLAAGVSSALLLAIKYQFKYHLHRICNTVYKKVIALSLLVILTAGGLYSIYIFKKDSADGRLLIWTVSANIIKDYPLFGVGFDRFKAHYMNYQAAYFQDQPESKYAMVADNVQYAFNEVLQITVENGLLVLILLIFLAIKFSIIFIHLQEKNPFLLDVIAIILSIIFFSLFAYPFQILSINVLMVICISSLAYYDYVLFNRIVLKFKNSIVYTFFISYLFFSILLMYNLKFIQKYYREWEFALNIYRVNVYEASVEVFSSIYLQFNSDGGFLQQYGKALYMTGQYELARNILARATLYSNTPLIYTSTGDVCIKMNDYEGAELAYRQASFMVPNRFYPEYLLAKLYEKTGREKAAVIIARKVIEKTVKIPSNAINEIFQEMEMIIEKYEDKEK